MFLSNNILISVPFIIRECFFVNKCQNILISVPVTAKVKQLIMRKMGIKYTSGCMKNAMNPVAKMGTYTAGGASGATVFHHS